MAELFLRLFNMSISATWIVLAVVILRLLLRKSPKWIRAALWGTVGLRLVLPFSFKSILSVIPSSNTIPTEITEVSAPYIESGFTAVNKAVNPVISTALAPNLTESVTPMEFIISAAATVWLVGIGIMLLYTVLSYWNIYLTVREGVREKDNIIRCDHVDTPFIMGIIKPKIYIPSNLEEQDFDYVIAHEKAHIKRRDHLWKPFAFALLTVYWYNPLFWVGYAMLCRDIEYACDEKVIKQYGDEYKAHYSMALLNCSIKQRAVTACPVAFGEVGIKPRIKNVLNYKKPTFWVMVISLILCVLLAVCFLTDPIDNGGGAEFITKKVNANFNLNDEVTTSSVTDKKETSASKVTSGSSISKVTSTIITEEEKRGFLNESDKFGDLELVTVRKIKQDYAKKIKNADISRVIIEDYYGTYDDGSILLKITYLPKGMGLGKLTEDVYVTIGDYYCRYANSEPITVYKNNAFYNLHTAYEKGIITDDVLYEFFIWHHEFNEGIKYFTVGDELGVLSFEQAIEIKSIYKNNVIGNKKDNLHIKYNNIDYKNVQLIYLRNLNDSNVMVKLNVTKPIENETTVVEQVLGYKYEHLYSEVVMVYNTKQNKLVNIGTAYEKGYVTKSEVNSFFETMYKNEIMS